MNTHKLHDEYSRQAHSLVASKLRANPSLINIAKRNLLEISKELPKNSVTVMEWEIILKCNIDSICDFIVQNNDHLQELRQSSPFSGMITTEERRNLREKIFSRTSDSSSEPNYRR